MLDQKTKKDKDPVTKVEIDTEKYESLAIIRMKLGIDNVTDLINWEEIM